MAVNPGGLLANKLFGEKIKIINEDKKQWVLCQSIEDNYTGYVKKNHLGDLKNTNYKITNLSFI